jgi:hypothetical protein
VSVNFGNKSYVSRFISFILVLVDLELNLTLSILLSCSSSRDHLQVALLHLGELLIQIGSLISYLFLNFVQILLWGRNLLLWVGSSDRANYFKVFVKFFRFTNSPPSRHHQDLFNWHQSLIS